MVWNIVNYAHKNSISLKLQPRNYRGAWKRMFSIRFVPSHEMQYCCYAHCFCLIGTIAVL